MTAEATETAAPPQDTPPCPPPYIPRTLPDGRENRHYQFARLVWEGLTYGDACREVGVSAKTAHQWRRRLCLKAKRHEGRGQAVNYEYVLREYVFGLGNEREE